MYIGANNEKYGGLEETLLACLLLTPEYMEELKVDERHFKKFGYILTFFKEFYARHKCLDVALMFSVVTTSSEMTLLDTITYLSEVFVIPTHFEKYQNQLLWAYKQSKKEEWLKKKIYEKATKLYMGNMTLQQYDKEIKRLYEQAEKIKWE